MKLERMSETNHARAELYETLALLSDRLNYAQRFDDAVAVKTEQIKDLKESKPLVFAGIVAGAAVAVGVAAYAVTNKIMRLLG